jgi:hypothetical protein
MFNTVQHCVIIFFGVSSCNSSQYAVHYQYNISAHQSDVMITKTTMGMFLMTGLVLAVASIYSIPMQQAMACGGGCDGGGKKGGGSLVNVETGDTKVGNIKTGHILSGNEIKALNNNKIGNFKDINVLSKNYLKDINVLGKNNVLNNNFNDFVDTGDILHYPKILNDADILNNLHSLVEVEDFANNLHSLAELEQNNVNTDILSSYYKEICGC